ncbi:MAG: NADH-quinone oxidoreductase subunit NuoE family protein [Planctomycetota bacterium]|jgi:NADH-quinone oxidoreductase subunit E
MAWTVKPSATTQIERRPEAYLTPSMKRRYTAEVLPRYEKKRGALLPILNDVQHRYRHIPYQAMEEVAELLGIQPAEVLDTVSFYEELRTRPAGQYMIGVCQSITCEVCGHLAILDHLRNTLDIEPGETTDDGKFSLTTLECLGSCDTAPVALVNARLHEKLTIESLDQLLAALPDEPVEEGEMIHPTQRTRETRRKTGKKIPGKKTQSQMQQKSQNRTAKKMQQKKKTRKKR